MKIFDNKADSEVIGPVIILGITILGIGLITLMGFPVINDLQEMASFKNVEQGFTVLDSRASRAALGEAPMQVTDISLGGGTLSIESNSSNGYILVELKNGSGVISNLPNITMGKIVYRLGDREVAYEGGGVWSKTSSRSIMLSPPEFHYNGVTLTIPVINISGNFSTGGKGKVSLNIGKVGEGTQIVYPTASGQNLNPIPDNVTNVYITIKSEYYEAWADYFEGASLVSVSSYPNEKKVVVKLETPPVFTNFTYGALASDKIKLKNSARVQSYSSSVGPHGISGTGNGSIRANNKIVLRNTAVVNGSALSGGTIDCDEGNGHSRSCGEIKKEAYGTVESGITVGIPPIHPAIDRISLRSSTSLVQDKIKEYNFTNNNSLSPCLSGTPKTKLDSSSWGTTCTIYGGNYYLTDFMLDNTGKNLVFDTSSGDVNIAINNIGDSAIYWKKANISVIPVQGNNNVKIYLNGGIQADGSGNNVINGNTNDVSSRFQIVSSSSKDILFKSTSFCGFVYAPFAEIKVLTSSQIYGALVGKEFEVEQSQDIFFDEALKNLNMDLGSGTTVLYLHLTRNDIGANIS